MTEIRAALTDLDGTVLRPGCKSPTPAVQTAARNLTVPLIPVTGRPYKLMAEVAEQLYMHTVGVVDDGATVADLKTGEPLWAYWLRPRVLRRVTRALMPFASEISYEANFSLQPATDVMLSQITDDAPSVFAVFDSRHEDDVRRALGDLDGIHPRISRHGDRPKHVRVAEVGPFGIHKGIGVHRALRFNGMEGATTLALADGKVDVPFFQALGSQSIRVAMGNSVPALFEYADYVAPSVSHDGFAVAVEYFGLTESSFMLLDSVVARA